MSPDKVDLLWSVRVPNKNHEMTLIPESPLRADLHLSCWRLLQLMDTLSHARKGIIE